MVEPQLVQYIVLKDEGGFIPLSLGSNPTLGWDGDWGEDPYDKYLSYWFGEAIVDALRKIITKTSKRGIKVKSINRIKIQGKSNEKGTESKPRKVRDKTKPNTIITTAITTPELLLFWKDNHITLWIFSTAKYIFSFNLQFIKEKVYGRGKIFTLF